MGASANLLSLAAAAKLDVLHEFHHRGMSPLTPPQHMRVVWQPYGSGPPENASVSGAWNKITAVWIQSWLYRNCAYRNAVCEERLGDAHLLGSPLRDRAIVISPCDGCNSARVGDFHSRSMLGAREHLRLTLVGARSAHNV
jgi:hypothetical protein